MNRSHLKPVLLIVLLVSIGFACSGDRPASNAVSAGNTSANQHAAANSISGSTNANNVAAENREYPEEVADEFIKSCEKAGSKRDFCECVFEKVQQQYTFEEFSVIESKIIAGTPPEDFVEFTGRARVACTK